DGDADALRDLGDGTDVVLVRPRGAVRGDGELGVDDLARQALDGALHVRAGAGKADVGRVDADVVHEVQRADFLVQRRIGHRRRLQAVAQRLVVELDLLPAGTRRLLARGVPVVDETLEVLLHAATITPLGARSIADGRAGAERDFEDRLRVHVRVSFADGIAVAVGVAS